MLGLCVINYIDAQDKEDYQAHIAKASTMDLGDMSVARASDEGMSGLEPDDDEPVPSTNVDAIVQTFNITLLQMLALEGNPSNPQGTLGGYTGLSAGQPRMFSQRGCLVRRPLACLAVV